MPVFARCGLQKQSETLVSNPFWGGYRTSLVEARAKCSKLFLLGVCSAYKRRLCSFFSPLVEELNNCEPLAYNTSNSSVRLVPSALKLFTKKARVVRVVSSVDLLCCFCFAMSQANGWAHTWFSIGSWGLLGSLANGQIDNRSSRRVIRSSRNPVSFKKKENRTSQRRYAVLRFIPRDSLPSDCALLARNSCGCKEIFENWRPTWKSIFLD